MDGFDQPVISGAAATAASGDDGSNAENKFGTLCKEYLLFNSNSGACWCKLVANVF